MKSATTVKPPFHHIFPPSVSAWIIPAVFAVLSLSLLIRLPVQKPEPAIGSIPDIVDSQRKTTIDSPLKSLFINKLTIPATITFDRYLDRIDGNFRVDADPPVSIMYIAVYFLGILWFSRISVFLPLTVLAITGLKAPIPIAYLRTGIILACGFKLMTESIMAIRRRRFPIPGNNPTDVRINPGYLIAVFIVAAGMRFAAIDTIPTAVNGDELVYAIGAKTAAVSGTDITGTWKPADALFFKPPPGATQAELPYLYLFPILKFSGLSVRSVRIPGAVMGTFTPVLIYLIAAAVFGNATGLAAGLVAAINPWLVFISRTGYEATPAMFFYLIGLWGALRKKKKLILLSVIPFILAFYSYIGTKTILIPFVITACILGYVVNRNKRLIPAYLTVSAFSLFLTLTYLVLLTHSPASARLGDITASHTLANTLAGISRKIPDMISFKYLFRSGDEFFSLYRHGLFYIPDILFFAIGISALFKNNKRLFACFFSFFAIGMAPHLINQVSSTNFTPHITLIFPFAAIIIATGIVRTIRIIPKRTALPGYIAVIAIYLMSLANFVNVYFFQYPLQGYTDTRMKTAAEYVSRLKPGTDVQFVINDYKDAFNKYLFYRNAIQPDTIDAIRKSLKHEYPSLGTIRFGPCTTDVNSLPPETVLIVDPICNVAIHDSHPIIIPRFSDSGVLFAIYSDTVCANIRLPTFILVRSLEKINRLSNTDEEFCTNSFIRYE